MKPTAPFLALTPVKQKGGKVVHAWAFEGDFDPDSIVSNTFTMEWPPKSGRQMEFPEIDRAEFFDLVTARKKIKAGQEGLVEELERLLKNNQREAAPAPEPAAVPVEKKADDTVAFEQLRAVTKAVKAIGGFTRLNELLRLIKEVGGLRKMKELLEAMSVPETDKIPF